MIVGWHYLPRGGEDPHPPMAASTFLDLDPAQGMRSPERLVRPYFKGRPDPREIAQKATAWHHQGCRVQIGNEPNNDPVEHFGGAPIDYADFFAGVILNAPGARLYWAGMSPGIPGWEEWYRHARGSGAVGVATHAYGTFDQMRSTVEEVRRLTGLPQWIAEVNFGAGQQVARDAWAVDHLAPFLDWCAAQPDVEAVTYFAHRWATPDMHLPTPVDGAGTVIESVLRAFTVPNLPEKPPVVVQPPGRPPMPGLNPWQRRLMTIWQLPPNPDDVIAACRAWQCDGVEIKVGDGNSSWLNRRNVTKTYVEALRSANLAVLGWTYNYCDGLRNAGDRGDGIPEEEAEVARDAVVGLALDGHTFDLEVECEGHPDLTAIMLDRFRKAMPGYVTAAHTWADLRGHERYPIHEISSLVDVIRPMIYRPVWTAADCWTSLKDKINGKPLVPVWGITEADPHALAIDRHFAEQVGWKGEAFWEFAARGREDLRRVVVGGSPAPPPQPPQPQPTDPDALTDAINGIAHHLNAAEYAAQKGLEAVADARAELEELKRAVGR